MIICKNCNCEFKGYGNKRGKKYCSRKCFYEYRAKELKEGFLITDKTNRPTIKKYLILLRGHECESCKLSIWLGQKLPLKLDHINGLANDNRVENLRLICGNCDSLSPYFAGRNRGRGRKSLGYKTN